jgi:predicted glycoside hydrolase/deacetylase ChbG (UPF0249 family)
VLIINADDMGASRSTTDSVIECFSEGTITSATAMVWMPESDRAAQLARELDLPIGLHLNLTLPFSGDGVPDGVRQRQLALTSWFDRDSWRAARRHAPDPSLITAAIADQLARFHATFGEPTHLDGHHHVHIHPAVLKHLPRKLPIRPPLDGAARAGLRHRRRLRQFRTPDGCLALEQLHPGLGGEGLAPLERARERTLEVMVHPSPQRVRDALLANDWRAVVDPLPRGSYRELS